MVVQFFRWVLAVATGIARDQMFRRKAMFAVTGAALGLLALGVFVLWDFFAANPLVFALFFLACGWLAVTAMLLAVYDMLAVLRAAREERALAAKQTLGRKSR